MGYININGLRESLLNSYGRMLLNEETEYIAQILKHQRHIKDYTLQETSDGICCVSYLSKLENLNVPVINDDFLPLLCERLDIDRDLSKSFIKEDVLLKAFKAYFTHHYDRLEEIYNELDAPCFSAASGIITSFYLLSHNDYKGVKEIFSSLDVIKNAMKFIEGTLFVYAISEYSIRLNNYNEAYLFIKNLDEIIIRDNYLNCAICENNIKIAFHLRNEIRFMYFYNQLKNINFLGFPNDHNLIVEAMYNTFIASNFSAMINDNYDRIDYDLIDEEVDDIKYYALLSKIEANILDIDCLKKLFDNFIKNEKYLSRIPKYLALLAYIAYLVNESHYYNVLFDLNKLNNVNNVDLIDNRFINFVLLYASSLDNEEFVEFTKETLINRMDFEQNFIYTPIYKECYENALLVMNKYRDVCLLEKSLKSSNNIKDRRIYSINV